MTSSLNPRLVLVTREAEYDLLLARHATRGQAEFFLSRRAQAGSMQRIVRQRTGQQAVLEELRAAIPKGWRVAQVRRAELDRFLFGPEDVVVTVGRDGLVANVAKYLSGQPVLGVNAEPDVNPGILAPHSAASAAALLMAAAEGRARTEARTMIRAELDSGQAILALNEVFVGHASHQSARYVIQHAGQQEEQSSSGVIIASGTGATGWALSISRATGVSVSLAPSDPAALFLVREPWPSRATGASLASGRLDGKDALVLVSRMNEGGVVFADGIEQDRLPFPWGTTLRVSVAAETLRFVPAPGPAARPMQQPPALVRTPPAPATLVRPPAIRTAKSPATVPVQTPQARRAGLWPAMRRHPLRAAFILAVLLAAGRACTADAAPPRSLRSTPQERPCTATLSHSFGSLESSWPSSPTPSILGRC